MSHSGVNSIPSTLSSWLILLSAHCGIAQGKNRQILFWRVERPYFPQKMPEKIYSQNLFFEREKGDESRQLYLSMEFSYFFRLGGAKWGQSFFPSFSIDFCLPHLWDPDLRDPNFHSLRRGERKVWQIKYWEKNGKRT